jgi:hypothetical protein
MRYPYFFALLLALGLPLVAHAQQPFEQFGVKVKILTLTNGRYPEFFDNDSLRRIGTVVYDTRLERVAYLLPPDSLVGRLESDITARWISVDPLAEKDAHISPYVYVQNNPVRYNDPDGRELVDPKGKTVTYSTNKDGSFTFSKNATESIRTFVTELSKNEVGRETLTGLVNIATKVGIDITSERAIGKDSDGKVGGLEGQTDGDGSIPDPKTGKQVYGSALITIYTGEYDAEVKEGSGQYSKSSLGKFINGVGTHEGNHALDDLDHNNRVQKDSGLKGKELQKQQNATHEDLPKDKERDANRTYPGQ